MKNLKIKLGDIELHSDGDKGCTGYIRGKMQFWFNQHSEIELLKWLADKYGRTISPDIISTDQAKREWKEQNPPEGGEKK